MESPVDGVFAKAMIRTYGRKDSRVKLYREQFNGCAVC